MHLSDSMTFQLMLTDGSQGFPLVDQQYSGCTYGGTVRHAVVHAETDEAFRSFLEKRIEAQIGALRQAPMVSDGESESAFESMMQTLFRDAVRDLAEDGLI